MTQKLHIPIRIYTFQLFELGCVSDIVEKKNFKDINKTIAFLRNGWGLMKEYRIC